MNNLVWVLNSALLGILLFITSFLWWQKPYLEIQKAPIATVMPLKSSSASDISAAELALIYQRDLFGTVTLPQHPSRTVELVSMPVPPPPKAPQPSLLPKAMPTFLPPLGIQIRGIIRAQYERDNRAIIADKKTNGEKLYRVGDSVFDAEIIRIEPHKVLLLRSNGQQEAVFISHAIAQNDRIYQSIQTHSSRTSPVHIIDQTSYYIDPEIFKQHVSNLAQCIDALDLTIAFEKGKAIGCIIGAITPQSLGALCGLRQGDIIQSINDNSVATTAQRLAVYRQIAQLQENDTIKLVLLRGEPRTEIAITYIIKSFFRRPKHTTASTPSSDQLMNSKKDTSFTVPPSQNMQIVSNNDKHAMLANGGRSAVLRPLKQ